MTAAAAHAGRIPTARRSLAADAGRRVAFPGRAGAGVASGSAGEVDKHGRASVPGRVVDPGFDVTVVRLACSASFVERIRNAVASSDAVGRAGEWVVFLCPARSVNAHEAEALGIIARVGVMDVEIYEDALSVCPDAGYLWLRRSW